MTPLEAAQIAVRLAGYHPPYLEALTTNPRALTDLVAAPAEAGRMVILRLPQGQIAFTWCYVDRPLSAPPQAEDWDRVAGRAVWIADLVATPGLTGVAVGRALQEGLAKAGITRPGQLVIYHRQGARRYGGAMARAAGKKPDVEVLFPSNHTRRH